MFERFTKDAREVVKGAFPHCEKTGERTVGAEHLLLALFDREGGRASFALGALGLSGRRATVRQALEEARRRGGLSRADTDALAGLGIDVSEIVARVEEAHGVGALSGDPEHRHRRQARRPGFGRDAKAALEKALRVAVGRRDRHIGDEHLLLALTVLPGPTSEVLADHGVTYAALNRVLYGRQETQTG
ncbi:Clp protease N-terminal domain-containing protein [Streptomyces sp. NBC_00557]|uniref:Clp protease N-terminal domain-containing protein n=1 Tax=Streptomyces sp. NBC_00557 TaxID=2975776 RepID=UPI002E817AF4|nr:Clp protease N-terminal domain-containing protein [Streptomyces sp. NBC_00557]WUC34778.1 peptidase [Streptomyces sp. NBC_00557]